MSELTYRYFYAGIIFNLLFSMFGYAFTSFPETGIEITNDLPIKIDSLIEENFNFVNITYFNISYAPAENWNYFEIDGARLRVSWHDHSLFNSSIVFQKQNFLEYYPNTWVLPEQANIWIGKEHDFLLLSAAPERYGIIPNSTIVNYFEADKGWTRLDIENKVNAFLVPIYSDDFNITKAVYTTGILTILQGEPTIDTDFSFISFAKWYWNSLFSGSYGSLSTDSLTSLMIKIMVIINLASGVIVVRDLFKV